MAVSFQRPGNRGLSSFPCASLQALAKGVGESEPWHAPQAAADRRYAQNIGRARYVPVERPEVDAAHRAFASEPGDDARVLERENVGHDIKIGRASCRERV